MGNLKSEVFRVLYLNKKNILLKDEVMQQGTVDRVIVYPREIAKRAISNGASAVILVHNHPSGEVKPSKEDIEITNLIKKGLEPLNIVIHDHVIISGDAHYSFKSSGLL
jgi:DNA repair protein RadC